MENFTSKEKQTQTRPKKNLRTKLKDCPVPALEG
jgi:hypothetical protein